MKPLIAISLLLLTICILAELEPRKLLKLGKELEEMLLYQKRHDGNKFMKMLLTYNDYLEEVFKNVEDETPSGNKLYKTLERELGPPHLRSKVYNVLMTRMFNLTFEQVEEVEAIIEKTREMWNQIQYVVNNRTLEGRADMVHFV
ncbi:hypothetical protein J6590_108754 [Homalodisca vitripennis]|nr:hypothetical protein J6590_108754 [Homalodisca vitripennis]